MKLSGKPCSCGAVGVLPDKTYRGLQIGYTYDLRLYNCARCFTTRVRVIEASRRAPPPPEPSPKFMSFKSLYPDSALTEAQFAEIMADLAEFADDSGAA